MTKSKSDKSEWKSPTVIISICALFVSIVWNIIQYQQNQAANAKTDEQRERADGLQRQKEDYLKNLNKELDDIDSQITRVQNQLRFARSGIDLKADTASDKALLNAKRNAGTLDELNDKKAQLEKQISDFYTKTP